MPQDGIARSTSIKNSLSKFFFIHQNWIDLNLKLTQNISLVILVKLLSILIYLLDSRSKELGSSLSHHIDSSVEFDGIS